MGAAAPRRARIRESSSPPPAQHAARCNTIPPRRWWAAGGPSNGRALRGMYSVHTSRCMCVLVCVHCTGLPGESMACSREAPGHDDPQSVCRSARQLVRTSLGLGQDENLELNNTFACFLSAACSIGLERPIVPAGSAIPLDWSLTQQCEVANACAHLAQRFAEASPAPLPPAQPPPGETKAIIMFLGWIQTIYFGH